ncbi:uncharacterized protein LOC116341125 isoform X2 [Contarinia nasturtii]|nr:uncharacterized protein LOC116341125 isoform X2 [Contarinia nasturtii]
MKPLLFILVVYFFNILEGVKSYDPLDDIIDDLTFVRRQKDEDAKDPSINPFAIYEISATIYANKFIDFLKNFTDTEEKTSARFKKLSSTTWLGHYMMKVHLAVNLSNQMSLSGTAFETRFSEFIQKKNLKIMRNICYILSTWLDSMLENSVNDVKTSPQISVDAIRHLYIAGQSVLADSNNDRFKRFGVYFIYFYGAVKRIKGTNAFYKDPVTFREYTNLVNKYITDQTGGLGYSYISSRIKAIKSKLEDRSTEVANAVFDDVSTQFINLFYNILEKFSSKLDVKSINEQCKKYIEIFESKGDDQNYQIVQDGHKMLTQLFGPKKSRSNCCGS